MKTKTEMQLDLIEEKYARVDFHFFRRTMRNLDYASFFPICVVLFDYQLHEKKKMFILLLGDDENNFNKCTKKFTIY